MPLLLYGRRQRGQRHQRHDAVNIRRPAQQKIAPEHCTSRGMMPSIEVGTSGGGPQGLRQPCHRSDHPGRHPRPQRRIPKQPRGVPRAAQRRPRRQTLGRGPPASVHRPASRRSDQGPRVRITSAVEMQPSHHDRRHGQDRRYDQQNRHLARQFRIRPAFFMVDTTFAVRNCRGNIVGLSGGDVTSGNVCAEAVSTGSRSRLS